MTTMRRSGSAAMVAVLGLALASCSSVAGSTSQPPVFDAGAPDIPAPVDVPPAVDVPPSECPLGCPGGRPICLHGGACVGVVDVATSEDATCALLTDTTVRCWGANIDGEVGNGTQTRQLTPTPVAGLRDVARIAASEMTMFAVMADGTVRRWGAISSYDSSARPALTPVAVEGFAHVRSLSASDWRICGVLTDGTVRCMGDNTYGQILRNDPRQWLPSPVTIPGMRDIVEIRARGDTPCARDTRGALWCAGYYASPEDPTSSAVQVDGVVDAVALTSELSSMRADCVAVRGGPLRCGSLYPHVPGPRPSLADVPGVSDVVQLDSWYFTCGVLRDTSVWCSQTPKPFLGPVTGVAQVAVGAASGCLRMLDGSLRCWVGSEPPTPVVW